MHMLLLQELLYRICGVTAFVILHKGEQCITGGSHCIGSHIRVLLGQVSLLCVCTRFHRQEWDIMSRPVVKRTCKKRLQWSGERLISLVIDLKINDDKLSSSSYDQRLFGITSVRLPVSSCPIILAVQCRLETQADGNKQEQKRQSD